ncbi:MAG TPA: zinc ribbon domain-containing protein [Spirochaetia bacterium]
MPIYEYECKSCGGSFELFMRSDTKVVCPSCESEKVVRKLSLFAAHTKHAANEVPHCHTGSCGCNLGKCGSGFCGVDS